MKSILGSATKIVMIMFAFSLNILVAYVTLVNPTNETVLNALMTLFTTALTSIISFYFGQKSMTTPTDYSENSKCTTCGKQKSEEI